jgi:hypothetical protein
MFYIDEYNSKTVTNTPPAKKEAEAKMAKMEMDSKQLAAFWYLAGVVIARDFEEVKTLLSKYGYDVSNEEDATTAIADMIGTEKWPRFVKEFGDIIEENVLEGIPSSEGSEESGFVGAIIAAIGQIGGSSLSLAASNKQLKAAKENAKSQMFAGLTNALAEQKKLEAEKEKTKQTQKKAIVWIVVSIILVIAIIVGIVIYKKVKANK